MCSACPEGSVQEHASSAACSRCASGSFSTGGPVFGAGCLACPPRYVGAGGGGCGDGRLSVRSEGVWWERGESLSAPAAGSAPDEAVVSRGGITFHMCPVEASCAIRRICSVGRSPSTSLPAQAAELALSTGAAVVLAPSVNTLRPLDSFHWDAAPTVLLTTEALLVELRSGNMSEASAAAQAAECDALPRQLLAAAVARLALAVQAAAVPGGAGGGDGGDGRRLSRDGDSALLMRDALGSSWQSLGVTSSRNLPTANGTTGRETASRALASSSSSPSSPSRVVTSGVLWPEGVLLNATASLTVAQALLRATQGQSVASSLILPLAGSDAAGDGATARVEPYRSAAEAGSWRRQQANCAEGHSGPLCSVCAEGWASAGFGSCGRCFDEPWENWAIFASTVLGVVAFCTWWISRRVTRTRLRTTASGAQRILLSFLQVLSVVTDLRTRAPKVLAGAGQVVSAAGNGFSLELYPVQCALGLGFIEKLYLYSALPFLMLLASAVVVFGCCQPCGGCKGRGRSSKSDGETKRPALQGGKGASKSGRGGGRGDVDGPMALLDRSEGKDVAPTVNPLLSRGARGDGAGCGSSSSAGGGASASGAVVRSPKGLEEQGAPAPGAEDAPATESACQRYSDLWVAASVVLVFLVYSRVFRALVDAFVAYPFPIEGSIRLQADLTVMVGTPALDLAQVVAAAAMLAYALGIPVAFVVLLCRNRHRLYPPSDEQTEALRASGKLTGERLAELLRSHSFFTRFSFAYDGTRHGLYWWEAVVLTRKVAIALCASLIRGPFVQAFAASVVLALSLVLHMHVKPYALYGLNALEAVSLGASLAAIFASTVFWRLDKDLTEGLVTESAFSSREALLVALLVAAVGLCLLLMLAAMCGALSVKVAARCCGGRCVEGALDVADSCCRHRSVRKRQHGSALAQASKADVSTVRGKIGPRRGEGKAPVADRLMWGGAAARGKASRAKSIGGPRKLHVPSAAAVGGKQ